MYVRLFGTKGRGSCREARDPDGNGVHGLNERISAHALFVGRDYLTDLVKAYADAT